MDETKKRRAETILSVADVDFSYSGEKGVVTALNQVRLDLEEGEFLCVLGPSGCGKSTLLRIIAGFLKPTAGEVLMENQPVRGPDWHRGVIFQAPTLYAWLNVRDNIAFGLKMRKFPKQEIRELTDRYIELVGLKGFETNKPYELSGGMKQRVALARALVNHPKILLMDEPFGALDALTRQKMQTLVRTIWAKTKNTVFLITHDVDEALALGTREVVMSSRPGTILNEFCSGFTYQFLTEDPEKVRYRQEYVETRREILKIINSQKEEQDLSRF